MANNTRTRAAAANPTSAAKAADATEKPPVPEIDNTRFFIVQASAVSGVRDGRPFDFPQGALVAEDEFGGHADTYVQQGAILPFEHPEAAE